MRCRRRSSVIALIRGEIPHSFKLPPLELGFLKQERTHPNPELSITCSRLRSKTTFVFVSRTGVISHLNAPVLRMFNSCASMITTVTSPTLSKAINIGAVEIAASSNNSSLLTEFRQCLEAQERFHSVAVLYFQCLIHPIGGEFGGNLTGPRDRMRQMPLVVR